MQASAAQIASNVQVLSTRFSGIRADGTNNLDIAFIENTLREEGSRL